MSPLWERAGALAGKIGGNHVGTPYIGVYASEDVKRAVERHEEDFADPSHFARQDFYSDSSQALAERAFAKAAIAAYANPLAYIVVMKQDQQVLAQLAPLR